MDVINVRDLLTLPAFRWEKLCQGNQNIKMMHDQFTALKHKHKISHLPLNKIY
jgi:hypothetical protein